MRPHRPGEGKTATLKKATPVKHAAKPKAKPAPRRRDQTSQFTDVGPKAMKAALDARKREIRTNGFKVTDIMLARARGKRAESLVLAQAVFTMAKPMKGVVPKGKATIAMDSQIEMAVGWAAQSIYNGAFEQGVTFLGYPYLAELAQRAEYRRVAEVVATEMTRKWITIKAHQPDDEDEAEPGDEDEDVDATGQRGLDAGEPADDDEGEATEAKPAMDFAPPGLAAKKPAAGGDAPEGLPFGGGPEPKPTAPDALKAKLVAKEKAKRDKDKRVKELEEEFKRLNVQACFKELAEQDGFFGRSHLFVDVAAGEFGDSAMDNPAELVMPIGDGGDAISQAKIQKGMLKRLKTVEAIWCYPANYNSANPLRKDWYKPTMWFVQGMEVHGSRLLSFIGREVPDMLKPAYSFGGLALTQMIQPTVLNWLRTRQSVSDIIHAFSVFVLKTNLGASIQEDGDQMFNRADLFNAVRDNRGLMMIDKESEEFENVSANLGSLDKLQAQSQEHICSVSGLPLVKYTGISPSGLNATSEFELQSWYEWIKAYQISFMQPNLTRVFHMAQLNLWGEVDPDLYFEFNPLRELTEKERSELEKAQADADKAYVDAGILNPEECRGRLSSDVDGPYAGISVEDAPEQPDMGQDDPFKPDGDDKDGDKPPGPDNAVAEPEA